MSIEPVVQILLATYNGGKYIRQQLESITNQTYTNWKLYISDDISTDNTKEILHGYKINNNNKVCILDNNHRFGNARDNFFHLLSSIDGDYFMFSDQDDVWKENKIFDTVNLLNQIPKDDLKKPLLVHSDLEVVDADLQSISLSFFQYSNISPKWNKFENLLIQNCVTGCTVMFNSSLRNLFLSGINNTQYNNYKILMHDWFLALIASCFGNIYFINQPLVYYRQHKGNLLGAKNTKSVYYLIDRILNIKKYVNDQAGFIDQAKIFYDLYSSMMNEQQATLLSGLTNIKNMNKIQRIKYLSRNNLFKYGTIRKLIQIVTI